MLWLFSGIPGPSTFDNVLKLSDLQRGFPMIAYSHHDLAPIVKNLLPPQQRKPAPQLSDELPFGKIHSNHMLVCDFLHDKGGWQTPTIKPFGPFSLEPDAVAFHYGQQVFEGLKAYRLPGSHEIALFRPEMNAKRFFHSAQRLGMEPVPIELFLEGIKALVAVDEDYVLPSPGSMYVRPCLIPLDSGVSYRAAKDYRFFVIVCAVKQYFSSSHSVSVYVEQEMVRATRGGTGDTKAGANYATSVLALQKAKNYGADSVLWLDAMERRYVEEIGAMNIVFVYEDRLVTPPLLGTILPGVTRDSVIKLARHLGLKIDEELTDINNLMRDIKSGTLKEAFGCGTAAVISPIGRLIFNGENSDINNREPGPITLKLKQALMDIQSGTAPDPFGWRVLVPIDQA